MFCNSSTLSQVVSPYSFIETIEQNKNSVKWPLFSLKLSFTADKSRFHFQAE